MPAASSSIGGMKKVWWSQGFKTFYLSRVRVNQRIRFPLSATYFLLPPALTLATFRPNVYVSVVPAGGECGKSGK